MNSLRCIVVALCTLLASGSATGQPRTPIVSSIDAGVGPAPAVVSVAGRQHLVYELHVTNFRPSAITVTRVDVIDAANDARLATLSGESLARRIGRPGAPPDLADPRVLEPGMRAVVYFWLPLEGESPPSRVRHSIGVEVDRAGQRNSLAILAAESDVRQERPVVLSAPLGGGPWVALYDPALMGGHRTAIYAVNGRARIPARFAVDFVRLHDDGTHARGDRALMANWHGYGADVLAVADATVVEAKDDMPEAPSINGAQGPIPLENASGNFVTLDLGEGRYAFYEHLQYGSIRVKAGDRVKAGQVIARLGNSGSSSSGPHLHFHVADARAELAGEGVPYVFAQFETVGQFDDINGFAAGTPWTPVASGASGRRRDELPAPNSVIVFPDQAPVALEHPRLHVSAAWLPRDRRRREVGPPDRTDERVDREGRPLPEQRC